jgi:hypothetical protein
MLFDAFADTMSCLHLWIQRLFSFGSHAPRLALHLLGIGLSFCRRARSVLRAPLAAP